MSNIDFSSYTTDQLIALKDDVTTEISNRQYFDSLAQSIQNINAQFFERAGITQGSEWRQPVNSLGAYPVGWVTEYQGKSWRNLTPNNPFAPGVSGWRQLADEGSEAEWLQPSGAHDAYMSGERVLHGGKIYSSEIDSNVWEPPLHWLDLTNDDLDPEQPSEPEEPTDPVYPDWKQPTGSHDAYNAGDRVIYEGQIWESTTNGNVWSPPTMWNVV